MMVMIFGAKSKKFGFVQGLVMIVMIFRAEMVGFSSRVGDSLMSKRGVSSGFSSGVLVINFGLSK